EARDAFALQAEHLVRRSSGRHLEQHLTVERGHFEFGAQRELRVRERQVDQHVVAVAREAPVFAFFHDDIEIARASVAAEHVARAAYGDVVAAGHTGRNLHRHRIAAANGPGAATIGTLVLHDGALAVTGVALGDVDELAEDGALHLLDLSRTLAGFA